MIIERTFDYELIEKILSHPEIYPYITDDGSPPVEDFAPVESEHIYYLTPILNGEVMGLFVLHPFNRITYQGHPNLLPEHRGKISVDAGKETIRWFFKNTACQKIISFTPSIYANALRYARSIGMRHEGINRASYMKNGILYDQYMSGITKGEAWA